MKSTWSLFAVVTVFAAVLLGIAPLASRAAEFTPDSPDALRSDSQSNPQKCSVEKSPAVTGCTITVPDQGTKSTETVEGDTKQAPEQIDDSKILLENLVKTGTGRYEEGS